MLKTIETVIGHWVTFIKGHEKLLLLAIAGLTIWHFGDKAFDMYGKHLTAAQQATNAQIAEVAKQNADIAQSLALLKSSVDTQAKIDDAKIAAVKKQLNERQKQDALLPLPELSSRWATLIGQDKATIVPTTNIPTGTDITNTVTVSADAAHSTVNELEKVGPLTTQLSATEDKLNGCTQVRTQQETQIAGLNTAIGLEKQGRADDAKVAKQAQRKSYMRGLKHGIIIGVVGTTAAFVAIFH